MKINKFAKFFDSYSLLNFGLHISSIKYNLNIKLSNYLLGVRNSVCIYDINLISYQLKKIINFLVLLFIQHVEVLFLGFSRFKTKNFYLNNFVYYLNGSYRAGILTNFKNNSVNLSLNLGIITNQFKFFPKVLVVNTFNLNSISFLNEARLLRLITIGFLSEQFNDPNYFTYFLANTTGNWANTYKKFFVKLFIKLSIIASYVEKLKYLGSEIENNFGFINYYLTNRLDKLLKRILIKFSYRKKNSSTRLAKLISMKSNRLKLKRTTFGFKCNLDENKVRIKLKNFSLLKC